MNIINDKVTGYINGLYEPVNDRLARLRGEAEEARVPIILRDTETFLLNLIRMKQPASILEIGTAVGYSAACMASVCPESVITSIEADETMAKVARDNICGLGLSERIQVLLGPGQEILDQLCGPYDFVFIDAAKSHYRTFWDKALPLCGLGAVIVCDNVLMKAMTVSDEYDPKRKFKTSIRNMREFLTYITNAEYADTSILSVGDGVSFSILKG